MLKVELVGGPSFVFCRKLEAYKPRIWSYKFNDATMSKSSGLRRQRIVPKHKVGRDTLRQGGRCALAANAMERWKVRRSSGGRHSLASPRWTSRCPEGCGRSSTKCRRCFQQTHPKPMHDQRRLIGTLLAQLMLLYALMQKWYLDYG